MFGAYVGDGLAKTIFRGCFLQIFSGYGIRCTVNDLGTLTLLKHQWMLFDNGYIRDLADARSFLNMSGFTLRWWRYRPVWHDDQHEEQGRFSGLSNSVEGSTWYLSACQWWHNEHIGCPPCPNHLTCIVHWRKFGSGLSQCIAMSMVDLECPKAQTHDGFLYRKKS